jgi:hypothetical protein
MNEIEWIKSLDKDSSEPSRVNVANSVMRDIRTIEQPAGSAAYGWMALFATLVGCGAVAFAFQAWVTLQDPLVNFMDSWKLVLQ